MSYIGIGVRPPTPSWGTVVQEGYQAIFAFPHLVLFPALAIPHHALLYLPRRWHQGRVRSSHAAGHAVNTGSPNPNVPWGTKRNKTTRYSIMDVSSFLLCPLTSDPGSVH